MEFVLQITLTTIQIASVYILFSLGLTLVFGVMRIVNFAHGHLFAISALIVAYCLQTFITSGFSPVVAYLFALLLGLAVSIGLGSLIYFFGFRFFVRDMEGSFILSIGLGLLLDGIFLGTFGGAVRPVPEILPGVISFFGVVTTVQRLVLIAAAVVITSTLYWILSTTKLGKGLRAAAIDHEAAMLQGVPYARMALIGFLIAAGLAGLAGGLIAPVTIVTPTIGADFLIKGFIAVIVGGLGNVTGAILGSLFVASVETIGGYYFDSSTAVLTIFVLVIGVLLVRPHGILGHG